MNTQRVNGAAGVILAALEQNRTPAGIALALESAGLLMTPETAADMASVSTDAVGVAERAVEELKREHAESARLRARVAELEAEPLAWVDRLDAVSLGNLLHTLGMATDVRPIDEAVVQVREVVRSFRQGLPEADGITRRIAPTQALREDKPAAKCRCDEPGADPYECEADDCNGEFSELNPFGGGPVHGHDAKVSRTCGACGWRTSVWHVNDGSAEEELHGHVVRVHGAAP
ncbi:hypothetical protein [Streptomyces luteogriseus]|uniref:hypothetical protein n=1 Tax=Streptomyces luteogriseus TaxID=68233 RepID=UPI003720E0D4